MNYMYVLRSKPARKMMGEFSNQKGGGVLIFSVHVTFQDDSNGVLGDRLWMGIGGI